MSNKDKKITKMIAQPLLPLFDKPNKHEADFRRLHDEFTFKEATSVDIIDNRPIKLDLASGQHPRPGFDGVDCFAPNAKYKVNLLQFPWPWTDGAVDEIVCSHFVEHIPMVYTDKNNNYHLVQDVGLKDLFLAFFDEVYRILKPDGLCEIVVPYLQSHRAFQDPTHRRFLCEASFLYLHEEWRKANGLDHYTGACNFTMAVDKLTDPYEGLRNPEAAAHRSMHYWNVCSDLKIILQKKPTAADVAAAPKDP